MSARTFIDYILILFPAFKRRINHFMDKANHEPIITGKIPLDCCVTATYSYAVEREELTIYCEGRTLYSGNVTSLLKLEAAIKQANECYDLLHYSLINDTIPYQETEKGRRTIAYRSVRSWKGKGRHHGGRKIRWKDRKASYVARHKGRPACPPPCEIETLDALFHEESLLKLTSKREHPLLTTGMTICVDEQGHISVASYNHSYKGEKLTRESTAA